MSNPTLADFPVKSIKFAMFVSQDVNWLYQYVSPNTKGFAHVQQLASFFSTVENASLVVPELAEFVGTSEARVQILYDYYWTGEFFAENIKNATKIVPLLGHPVQSSNLFIGLYVFFTVLAVTFAVLRVHSRLLINGRIRSYDWILMGGTFFTVAFGMMQAIGKDIILFKKQVIGILIFALVLGGTSHYRGPWDRSWYDYNIDMSASIASDILYPIVIFLIKTSLLLFYYRLIDWFPLKLATILTLVVVTINSLCMIFIWIFHCNPPIYWTGDLYITAECNSKLWKKSEVLCGGINIATDIVIWLIPLPMVWKITQSTRERILSFVTFGVGAIACVACGIRLGTVRELSSTSLTPPNAAPYCIWTMLELYLAIICSSVPAIRALLIRSRPNILRSPKNSEGKGSAGTDLQNEKNEPDVTIVQVYHYGSKPDSPT